ncbi:hypothetical protein [Corynebacterium cystitidis]|uniref:Uncharacterized protein n=1 Tax=Corynebacterium cystitidis DSM 20524 TaxID=1121357 RepID=A0A1H9REM1_9CORY|nr:hypothetical protein [Corynebacterium cystitidis]WJY81462.1 hypothetical protein CCYS_02445 [Corynebacterium cystitidis DSM 20524]SER71104.1 hypothetical protein SAMN05661109_00868 [Corynebacterium cystitidis DSM 20524]SNV87293.1 Uncharacterised protein [Corynebacterium cystitidis]
MSANSELFAEKKSNAVEFFNAENSSHSFPAQGPVTLSNGILAIRLYSDAPEDPSAESIVFLPQEFS